MKKPRPIFGKSRKSRYRSRLVQLYFKYPNITKIHNFIQRYNSKYPFICPNSLIYHLTSLYSAVSKTFGISVPDFFFFQPRRQDFGRKKAGFRTGS
ncbi:unnamed protein product [Meloidogyne enterolobii]|uniref:Uncharacterized protein n=1 Tax=Meloidogyne enterolobii TaxID=390850 RepID=A0ACB0YNJ1_MELEN